ncbi:hypothetical protein Goklo_016134, partial [Gossypium klotzschianum]|nr:hypothetical protein [Gossypium klotzschianum]
WDKDGGWTEYIRIGVKIDVLRPFNGLFTYLEMRGPKLYVPLSMKGFPLSATFAVSLDRLHKDVLERRNTLKRPNEIKILEKKINSSKENNGNKGRNEAENNITILKGKEKVRVGEEELESYFSMEKCPIRSTSDGEGKMKCKQKRTKGRNRENIEESPTRMVRKKLVDNFSPCKAVAGDQNLAIVRELKKLLVANNPDVVFLCETKMHSMNFTRVRNICWMSGCLDVNSEVVVEGNNSLRFMGFYDHVDLNLRNSSWDILRTMGSSVREDWIVGGDFNAIINEAEKAWGRRKSRVTMDEFREVMEELTLIGIKTNKGWFMWANN